MGNTLYRALLAGRGTVLDVNTTPTTLILNLMFAAHGVHDRMPSRAALEEAFARVCTLKPELVLLGLTKYAKLTHGTVVEVQFTAPMSAQDAASLPEGVGEKVREVESDAFGREMVFWARVLAASSLTFAESETATGRQVTAVPLWGLVGTTATGPVEMFDFKGVDATTGLPQVQGVTADWNWPPPVVPQA